MKSNLITEDTFLISDLHLNHKNILIYEPIRLEYLSDYETDVTSECQQLLSLLETIPKNEIRENNEIRKLSSFLIPFHNEMLIDKWNNVVSANDTVFCLGDFAFGNIHKFTSCLNGRKILLLGNHDERKNNYNYVHSGWDIVIDDIKLGMNNAIYDIKSKNDETGLFLDICKEKILFSHHPVFNNNDYKYGTNTKILEDFYIGLGSTLNIHGHTHSRNSTFEKSINVSVERCTSLSPMKLNAVLSKKTK